ncbi:potassium transporter KefA [Parazoarcus communis]|uniref:Potassium transporter KefA n=2 Tax=Parazoarcus communis TaxID=41977 RepID=A0A2U8GNT5_9RHOO|nr:potassium transporter KefA [Parazoarcus communis]
MLVPAPQPGIDIASLAIVGGAMGVGIGFGLQNIFSNLVSGIIILLEKTLKLGDFVDLQSGAVGKVTEIGLRYTRVTTNDNVDVIVPNSEFINGRVTNWTFDDDLRRIHIPFGVAYGTDKDKVRDAVAAAARKVAGTILLPGREPEAWLVGFGDSSLDFELVVWVNHDLAMSPARTQARYLWEIDSALRAAGIEIPFPQRDLHVRSGTLSVDLKGGPAQS